MKTTRRGFGAGLLALGVGVWAGGKVLAQPLQSGIAGLHFKGKPFIFDTTAPAQLQVQLRSSPALDFLTAAYHRAAKGQSLKNGPEAMFAGRALFETAENELIERNLRRNVAGVFYPKGKPAALLFKGIALYCGKNYTGELWVVETQTPHRVHTDFLTSDGRTAHYVRPRTPERVITDRGHV